MVISCYSIIEIDSELHGSIEISDGSVEVAFPSLGITPVSVCQPKFRIQLDRLIMVGHCSIQIALPLLDSCAVFIGVGKFGLSSMA
jgi:hypothetical protein